jgi:hypothetical protein
VLHADFPRDGLSTVQAKNRGKSTEEPESSPAKKLPNEANWQWRQAVRNTVVNAEYSGRALFAKRTQLSGKIKHPKKLRTISMLDSGPEL